LSFLAFGHRVLANDGSHGFPNPIADSTEKISAWIIAPGTHQLHDRIVGPESDHVQELILRHATRGPNSRLIGHLRLLQSARR
jgi:hypothetical protein